MFNSSLSGVRIWLSGSVPENAKEEERASLHEFTRRFAEEAFQRNATVLHGFHPTLTPTLVDVAHRYQERSGGKRAPLHLVVSSHYRDNLSGTYLGQTADDFRRCCDIEEIPSGPTESVSISRLRDALAARADALVAIGGKWWATNRTYAGIPQEFELAVTRGIPSFILGGLGGAASSYLKEHEAILLNVKNGWDQHTNLAMAQESNVPTLVDRVISQLALLPLGRRETVNGERFRILCLDGGGVRGAFTASMLAQWEHNLEGCSIADHFDLIAGTSTGGILAIGLGLGLPAVKLLDFYKNHASRIFPMTSLSERLWHRLMQVVGSKFEVSVLEDQLAIAYDEVRQTTLADARTRLLITSYNLTANTVTRYRTPHYPGVQQNEAPRSVAVGRATSAAPTYFRAATVDDPIASHEAVDGGVWANCPAMAALGEAVGILKVPLDRIDMLSLGTAGLAPVIEPPGNSGLSGWALKAADLFLNSQMEATLLYSRQLLGDRRFLRIDDHQPRVEEMDNPEKLDYLVARGKEVADNHMTEIRARFLNGICVQPWRADRQEP